MSDHQNIYRIFKFRHAICNIRPLLRAAFDVILMQYLLGIMGFEPGPSQTEVWSTIQLRLTIINIVLQATNTTSTVNSYHISLRSLNLASLLFLCLFLILALLLVRHLYVAKITGFINQLIRPEPETKYDTTNPRDPYFVAPQLATNRAMPSFVLTSQTMRIVRNNEDIELGEEHHYATIQ